METTTYQTLDEALRAIRKVRGEFCLVINSPDDPIFVRVPIVKPCRGPHWWAWPQRGDDALQCEACGHRSPFANLHEFKVHSIASARHRLYPTTATMFMRDLRGALDDWHDRNDLRVVSA